MATYFHVTEPHRDAAGGARSLVDCGLEDPDPARAEVRWEDARPLGRGDLPEAALVAEVDRGLAAGRPRPRGRAYAGRSLTPGRPLRRGGARPGAPGPRRLRLRPRRHHREHPGAPRCCGCAAGSARTSPTSPSPGCAATAWPRATSAATWRPTRRRAGRGWSAPTPPTPGCSAGSPATAGCRSTPPTTARPATGTSRWPGAATMPTCRRSRASSSPRRASRRWRSRSMSVPGCGRTTDRPVGSSGAFLHLRLRADAHLREHRLPALRPGPRLLPGRARPAPPRRASPRAPTSISTAATGSPTSPRSQCFACSLTRTRPNDADLQGLPPYYRAEQAKRRLLYELDRIGLPVEPHDPGTGQGLAFDLLSSVGEDVITGHADGVITLDLAEGDTVHREKVRLDLGETYRTLLGHFRHEIGHYYWTVLVEGRDAEGFRAVFGDERASYADAIERHYAEGPPVGWEESYVSAYATMHPWEDFAETFAHVLHIRDALETAHPIGLSVDPQRRRPRLRRRRRRHLGAAVGGAEPDEPVARARRSLPVRAGARRRGQDGLGGRAAPLTRRQCRADASLVARRRVADVAPTRRRCRACGPPR